MRRRFRSQSRADRDHARPTGSLTRYARGVKNGPSDGMMLGIANAAVIAVGLSAVDPDFRLQMATVVFLFGSLPAILAGAALGRLADALAESRVWVRRLWLVVPAWLVVVVLGVVIGMVEVVFVACIPTTAAALLLEKRTRARSDAPVAIVRR
jgi:hypothetical protein